MAGGKSRWLLNATAYTVAGSLASGSVGATVGWLGGLLNPGLSSWLGIIVALAIGLIAFAREVGWISFPLPQLRRQTKEFWGKVFPGSVAAILWGLDLGLTFTTRLTFSGVWLVAGVAVIIGEPSFGAALFLLYWLGRALSVWIAPLLMPDANATPWVMDVIYAHYRLFQRVHVLGLAWSVAVLIIWLALEKPV